LVSGIGQGELPRSALRCILGAADVPWQDLPSKTLHMSKMNASRAFGQARSRRLVL